MKAPIRIRITGCEGQDHNGACIGVAYSFELIGGTQADVTELLTAKVDRPKWLADVAPSDDGWMLSFGALDLNVGAEIDMRTGMSAEELAEIEADNLRIDELVAQNNARRLSDAEQRREHQASLIDLDGY